MSKFKNGGLFDMKINKKRITAVLMTFAMLSSSVPVAYAGQQNSYHDPADNWLESANRTEELDVNSTVTKETFQCYSCDAKRLFTVMRTPEYTRDGQTALSRNVRYSDGTMTDGETKGSILDGTPNKDATYSGYHWTKSVCDTCATINGNMPTDDYGFNKNVYWLYDCAEDFMQELEQTVSYAYADDTYHTKTTEEMKANVVAQIQIATAMTQIVMAHAVQMIQKQAVKVTINIFYPKMCLQPAQLWVMTDIFAPNVVELKRETMLSH